MRSRTGAAAELVRLIYRSELTNAESHSLGRPKLRDADDDLTLAARGPKHHKIPELGKAQLLLCEERSTNDSPGAPKC
jgi:hypothetical protein